METELPELFNDILQPIGFSRGKLTWRRQSVESIHVVGLQKSVYENIFYVNLGIFYPRLEELKAPMPKDCHIQTRLGHLHPEPGMLEQVLDQSEKWKMEMHERTGVIKYGIMEAEKRFFRKFATMQAALDFMPQMSQNKFSVLAPLYHFWEKVRNA